ncbi:Histone Acetyltransferase Kat7, partial [Manis pentadactyla]
MEESEGPTALVAPQKLSRALAKGEDGQKATQGPAENRPAELVGQEDWWEVEVDDDDDDKDDDEFLDESGDELDDESECEEDDYDADIETEESQEEDGSSQEGAEVQEGARVQEASAVVPATHEPPMIWFCSLIRNAVQTFLRYIHYNGHVQGQPHSSPVVVRHGSQEPEDPGEGPVPWEREEPGEGPAAPQKQEEPGKGARACKCGKEGEEVQEAGGEEEHHDEEPEEGRKKDLDPAEGQTRRTQ